LAKDLRLLCPTVVSPIMSHAPSIEHINVYLYVKTLYDGWYLYRSNKSTLSVAAIRKTYHKCCNIFGSPRVGSQLTFFMPSIWCPLIIIVC